MTANQTPAHRAALSGDEAAMTNIALHHPATLSVPDENGHLPIHLACAMGYPNILRIILQHAPETARVLDNNGRTPEQHVHVVMDLGMPQGLRMLGITTD